MITFSTILLGLVMGPLEVAVTVGSPVSAVEFLVDGESVARLQSAPWSRDIDFGAELSPHCLEAIAWSDEGVEIGRTLQWVNLPRQAAEAELALLRRSNGVIAATLQWGSLTATPPSSVHIELDGRPLVVETPGLFELPAVDEESIHFLRAELEFGETVRAVAELAFGGIFGQTVASRLTGVPVVLDKRQRTPDLQTLEGVVLSRGERLSVVAVEKPGADLVFVLEEGARTALAEMSKAMLRMSRAESLAPRTNADRPTADQGGGWRAEFLWSVPRRQQGASSAYDLFPHSQRHTAADGELHKLLTTIPPLDLEGEQRVADAVAIAGLQAASSGLRRTVILITSPNIEDHSLISASVARSFLKRLRVPLRVWSIAPPSNSQATVWGELVDGSTPGKLERASRRVVRELERQRIVWVEGEHLPQDINLSEDVRGLRLAGS